MMLPELTLHGRQDLKKAIEKKRNWTTLKNKHLFAFTHSHGDPKRCDPWEGEEKPFTMLLLFLYVKKKFSPWSFI